MCLQDDTAAHNGLCNCSPAINTIVDTSAHTVPCCLAGSAFAMLSNTRLHMQCIAAARGSRASARTYIAAILAHHLQAHSSPTLAMAADASGALLATGCAAGEIRVWDVPGGFCTHSFAGGHTGLVLALTFHSRELLLASAGDDGAVVLWDLVTKKQRKKLSGHVSAVAALAWAPGGWHLLSAGRDQVVIVWDIRSHEKLRTVAVFEAVQALAVLPAGVPVPGHHSHADQNDAILFATGGESGLVSVWDGRSGQRLHRQTNGESGHARAVSGGGGDARDISVLIPLQRSRALLAAAADGTIARLAPSPQGLQLQQTLLGNVDNVTAACFTGAARAPTHTAAPERAQAALPAPADGAAVAPPPESVPPQLVLASSSAALHVLSTDDLSCQHSLVGHTDTVLALAVAHFPAHDCWLVLSGSKDKTVRLWHLGRQECLAVGSGHLGAVNAVAFASKNAAFAVTGGADKLARVWDLAPALQSLAQTATEKAEKRKPAKLAVLSTVAAHEKEVNCVAVAPNNQLAATGGADRCAKLWQLPALAAPRALRGHRRGVMDIQFAPISQVWHSELADSLFDQCGSTPAAPHAFRWCCSGNAALPGRSLSVSMLCASPLLLQSQRKFLSACHNCNQALPCAGSADGGRRRNAAPVGGARWQLPAHLLWPWRCSFARTVCGAGHADCVHRRRWLAEDLERGFRCLPSYGPEISLAGEMCCRHACCLYTAVPDKHIDCVPKSACFTLQHAVKVAIARLVLDSTQNDHCRRVCGDSRGARRPHVGA